MQTVQIAGIDLPVIHENPGWIPETDIIITPTTRHNLQKIIFPLIEGQNILLVGDAGAGKNALIYYINQLRRHPTIRYSFNEDTLPEDLVGAYRIDPATNHFVWANGSLAHAMQIGATFVADEMNLCPPEVLKRFSSVFTDRTLQMLEGDSSHIAYKPGFNFIATQNPAEGFEGRKNLPREIQKYFTTVYIDPYPENEILDILKGLHPKVDPDTIRAVVAINTSIEKMLIEREIGQRDLERYHFNIRNMNRLLNRIAKSTDTLWNEICDIYMRPFRNTEDRQKIQDSIKSICANEKFQNSSIHQIPHKISQMATEEPQIHISSQNGQMDIGRACLNFMGKDNNEVLLKAKVNEALEIYPPVNSVLPLLESIACAIEHKENILLECESDVEPEDIVHFYATLLNKKLTIISLSRGMHTTDILGGLKPVNHKKDVMVDWVDGPLTRAVRESDFILIKGLEAAGPELVEKLNMLLDDARALSLPPESGELEPLRLGEDARIFGLKYFRNQRSVPSISRAFRNRFSAYVVYPIEDKHSLMELAESYLGLQNKDNAYEDLLNIITDFHLFIREMTKLRKIGSGNIQPYSYGLTNLKRFCHYLTQDINRENTISEKRIQEIMIKAVGISYTNEISLIEEREKIIKSLISLLSKTPLLDLINDWKEELKKKSQITKTTQAKKIWWDQDKHWRKPNTGKFKPKMTGRTLKEGIEINTPETGGNTKSGPDAWYGSDTQGNMGQGEPGHGGGAWGYRTEELYKEFLKKRRPLWDYQMGVSLEDFRSIFDPEIERVIINFDRLLDPQVDISRRYLARGSRVDVRRYLSYLSGQGDGRVFDKTTIDIDDDKLKGVEIIFAVNKGRRIFNFEYSIATLVSIMSCSMILKNHELIFGVAGYSDLNNQKDNIDIQWLKTLERDFDEKAQLDLFNGLSNDWHGDTVIESHVLEELANDFSPDARTRILVMISDFRGYRAKVTIAKDIESFDTGRLKGVIDDLGKRGVILLGVGVGARAISDVLFQESLQVGGENFSNLPALLSSKVTELIHKHHNAVTL